MCARRNRTMQIAWTVIVLVVAITVYSGVPATAAEAPSISFDDVWARAASEGHMSAVYMDVTNAGKADVTIVAAATDVAERTEVHETKTEITVEGGKISQVMRMEEIDGLEVGAGTTVSLRPGGLHIMLIDLTRDIEEGDRFTLHVELADGTRIPLDVVVTVGAGDDAHDEHAHH